VTRGQPTDQMVFEHLEALRRLGRDDLMRTLAEDMRPGEGATAITVYEPGRFAAADVTGHTPADWARFVLHLIDSDRWALADAVFGRPLEPGDVAGLEAFTGTNRERFIEERSNSRVAQAWQQENARHARATTPELAHVGYTGLDWEHDIPGYAAEYLGSCQGKDIYHDGDANSGRLIVWDCDTCSGAVLATGVRADLARRAVERAKELLDRRASLYDVRALATSPSAQSNAATSM
jgi:hypothetical protein